MAIQTTSFSGTLPSPGGAGTVTVDSGHTKIQGIIVSMIIKFGSAYQGFDYRVVVISDDA